MSVKLQAKLTAKESKYDGPRTKVNNIYFELFDKYFDSFAVKFACNLTDIFGSVVWQLISLTVRLGCLWIKNPNGDCADHVSGNFNTCGGKKRGNQW